MHHPGEPLGGRYRLEQRLGAGGMGEVWLATDLVLQRRVAVKLVLPSLLDDTDFVRRFLTEAQAMAQVRHSGVVAIHDFHADSAGAYLVMEYVPGGSLAALLSQVGRLAPAQVLRLVGQAAAALQAVHERGIVHRDVKPANILIRADGSVALTDFGIALGQRNTVLTASGEILGTPSYLSPEQVLGRPATPRSDLYALGVVAYECLAGRRPFVGENPFAVALQRVNEAPPPLPADIPDDVAQLVHRALATDPALRWPSAAQLTHTAERLAARYPDIGTGPTEVVRAGRRAPGEARARRPAPGRAEARASGQGRWPGRGGRRVVLIVAAVLLVGGLTALAVRTLASGASPGAGAPAATGASVGTGASPATGASVGTGIATAGTGSPVGAGLGVPAGFVGCTGGFCPASPLCWDGTNTVGGVAQPLRPKSCDGPHVWETFLGAYVPADILKVRQDELLDRSDIAALCSPANLATRSRDPAQTHGMDRDAWPVPVNASTVLLECMVHGTTLETTGSLIRTG